ncbi:hypothetical protein LVB77_08525 [Lysobacter sp. 5GHs7-4]|uniref:hypothetical protein n=1 Tax=Lysobacter sp. 5GHs7-4 TaxID=2904253 RepID=UPI001E5A9D51|nr:hypothetical protein [Lysobacter sp. 5GHs7-4]UHQ24715.1 hypothetical protein LVB77_08525 [Lysobacter sp. 5GHs7-4]
MNQITAIASGVFAVAIAVETVVWLTFLHQLKVRHPRQWLHAEQPIIWQGRTVLSARSTMLYLHHRVYSDSFDRDGIHYCGRYRVVMLIAYWLTAITGFAALVTLTLYGW